ncbi:hypothetical protein AMTRI_Chr01g128950 [Amborella trichopoda]
MLFWTFNPILRDHLHHQFSVLSFYIHCHLHHCLTYCNSFAFDSSLLALYLCDLFLPLVLSSILCSFGMYICDPLAFHYFP